MARFSIEIPVTQRRFHLVEAESEQEALQKAKNGDFDTDVVFDTIVEPSETGPVSHGVFEDWEGWRNYVAIYRERRA